MAPTFPDDMLRAGGLTWTQEQAASLWEVSSEFGKILRAGNAAQYEVLKARFTSSLSNMLNGDWTLYVNEKTVAQALTKIMNHEQTSLDKDQKKRNSDRAKEIANKNALCVAAPVAAAAPAPAAPVDAPVDAIDELRRAVEALTLQVTAVAKHIGIH